MMSCRHFCASITDEREGALSLLERAAFRFHRTICRSCRCYEESLDTTVELLHEAAPEGEKAPEEMRKALLARMKAGKGQ